jgi:hypothetical protein
MTQQKPP